MKNRLEFLSRITKDIDHDIEPVSITGLVADFVKTHNVSFLVRGIRSHADLDSEIIMGVMNRILSGTETVMLMSKEGNIHISSSIIKTLGTHDKKLHNFIPDEIEEEVYDHIFKTLK